MVITTKITQFHLNHVTVFSLAFKKGIVSKLCSLILSLSYQTNAHSSQIMACAAGGGDAHTTSVHRGRQNQPRVNVLVAALRLGKVNDLFK